MALQNAYLFLTTLKGIISIATTGELIDNGVVIIPTRPIDKWLDNGRQLSLIITSRFFSSWPVNRIEKIGLPNIFWTLNDRKMSRDFIISLDWTSSGYNKFYFFLKCYINIRKRKMNVNRYCPYEININLWCLVYSTSYVI